MTSVDVTLYIVYTRSWVDVQCLDYEQRFLKTIVSDFEHAKTVASEQQYSVIDKVKVNFTTGSYEVIGSYDSNGRCNCDYDY
jgi:hypothetical protein